MKNNESKKQSYDNKDERVLTILDLKIVRYQIR